MHGALQCGALANTFTSSQGLMLMIRACLKLLVNCSPGVFHVASRTVASHALTIFAEHNDVMTTRELGLPCWLNRVYRKSWICLPLLIFHAYFQPGSFYEL